MNDAIWTLCKMIAKTQSERHLYRNKHSLAYSFSPGLKYIVAGACKNIYHVPTVPTYQVLQKKMLHAEHCSLFCVLSLCYTSEARALHGLPRMQ